MSIELSSIATISYRLQQTMFDTLFRNTDWDVKKSQDLFDQALLDIAKYLQSDQDTAFFLEGLGTADLFNLNFEGGNFNEIIYDPRPSPFVLISHIEPITSMTLAHQLNRQLGVNVIVTNTPPFTLLVAHAFIPNLIVSDFSNTGPGLYPGLWMGEVLKKMKRTQEIPILYASSLDSYKVLQEAFDFGANAYLKTPLLKFDEFIDVSREIINDPKYKSF